MRKYLHAATLILALGAGPFGTAHAEDLQPRDVFALARASDPRFSPNGAQIAYVRVSNDIMVDKGVRSIWLVDVRTGAQTPMAAAMGDASSPRWSPDGTRIAYLETGADGIPELMIRWLASGQTARVARLPRPPQELSWSPDGQRIAFVMLQAESEPVFGAALDKPKGAEWADPLKVISSVSYRADGRGDLEKGRDHVFVIDADGGAPRQLTFGVTEESGPLAWTPDGQTVLFTGKSGKDWELAGFRSAVFAVPAQGGQARRLTSQDGPDGQVDVSPNGRSMAFVSYDDHYRGYENQHVYVAPSMGPGGANWRRGWTGAWRTRAGPPMARPCSPRSSIVA
jgi:Tol biopolymer transport system component